MSPLSGGQVLDRLAPAATSGIAMPQLLEEETTTPSPVPLRAREVEWISEACSKGEHAGPGWKTVTTARTVRVGYGLLIVVGFLHSPMLYLLLK